MSDEGPGFFADKHVAIFGLGLMGGSAARVLKGKCRRLTGIDPNPAVVQAALLQKVVDRADVQPGDLLVDVDLVILAAPVNSIVFLLSNLPSYCPNRAMVIDFGSTKKAICEAMRTLPYRFDPVGGHPMSGKETSGLENADPSLFKGAVFALVALDRTSPVARTTAEALVGLLGSHPLWLDAAVHDRHVAATSHLPYLISNALAFCTPVSAAPLTATGFASATRLAGTSPDMMMDVLQTNRDAILASLHQYRDHLAMLENLLSTGDLTQLRYLLEAGSENRNRIEMFSKGDTL